LVCRQPLRNDFQPALIVDVTVDRVRASEPDVTGTLVLPPTDWGCSGATFVTTRTFWDTTVGVRARLRDAPLPITVLRWQVEHGNFSTNTVGGTLFLDSRPMWSGDPKVIAAGTLMLTGNVNHPDPPLVLIFGSGALGHLQHRTDVAVQVAGNAEKGWQLSFSGVDGNFYARFSVDVQDGDGIQWHGETFVPLQGDHLELPFAYTVYKSDCDAKFADYVRAKLAGMGNLVAVAEVRPGQPVMSQETRQAIAIRTLLAAGDPAALRHMIAAGEQFGSGVFRQIGQVAPAPMARDGITRPGQRPIARRVM
jgi:hypothetical protein